MQRPSHIYHYTSIEGLAHILKTKQIRFSRLDLLDDVSEGQSMDSVDLSRNYFVSCWTDEKEESIPLWNMYTPDMKGVRLKLPTDLFKLHKIDLNEVPDFIKLADTSHAPENSNIVLETYMPYNTLHGEDYFVLPTSFINEDWPFKVTYTDDESLLNQTLIGYHDELKKSQILTGEVAKYKKKIWSFQNEWRFRILCLNAAPRSLKDKVSYSEYYDLMLKELSTIGKGVSPKYLFLDIDDDAFRRIELSLGPKVEPAQEIIVDALVKAHCPTAIVKKSKLSGKIR